MRPSIIFEQKVDGFYVLKLIGFCQNVSLGYN